jgi:hypothetical protein
MCLLLNLRGVVHTLNYPKDTQLNTTVPDTNLRYCASRLLRKSPAQPCNFFTQSISLSNIQLHRRLIRCPPWGGLNSFADCSALLKDQSPCRLSSLNRDTVPVEHFSVGIRLFPTSRQNRARYGAPDFVVPYTA